MFVSSKWCYLLLALLKETFSGRSYDSKLPAKHGIKIKTSFTNHQLPGQNSELNMEKYFEEPYQITVNSSSPAVLDSVIRFSANISSLEKVLFNKTLFVYFWVNTANKNTLTSEANYTSSIDIDTFLSYAVNPGEYHMKVSVYKKEKIWPFNRHVKIGHAATKFILTEFLNGKLTIKQQLNDKMYVHNQTFATQKPLNLTSVLTDEFENDYTYAYIWFVNGTFQEWNETYSNITYNGITPGNLNITVQVKASFDFLLNKEGVFTKFITLKDTKIQPIYHMKMYKLVNQWFKTTRM